MKTLKEEGVPFTARFMFRAQYAWFVIMLLCLLLTLPVAALWACIHESGQQFIDALNGVLEEQSQIIGEHRKHLISLYKPKPGDEWK